MGMKLNKKISPTVLKNLKEDTTFEFQAKRHPIERLIFVKINDKDDTYNVLADTGGGFPIPLGVCDSTNLADLLNDENLLSRHTYLDLTDCRSKTIEDRRILYDYILHGTRTTSPARKPAVRKTVTRKPATRKPTRK